MNVVDADFEDNEIRTGKRKIWITIGCHTCGHHVLDSIPFTVGKTGYSLLPEARAQVTEFILEVNGREQLADIYEVSLRSKAALEINAVWDRYYPEPLLDPTCTNLLLNNSELCMMSDCIRLIDKEFDLLPHGGTSNEIALRGITGDAGRILLGELAKDMSSRACNESATDMSRTVRRETYHSLPLPKNMVTAIARCIAYAIGNPEQMAHYLFATYGDRISDGMTEDDFVSQYVKFHEHLRVFPRMLMCNLSHYYKHIPPTTGDIVGCMIHR
jgi:hypothetical protein